jgi:hypothetical protein
LPLRYRPLPKGRYETIRKPDKNTNVSNHGRQWLDKPQIEIHAHCFLTSYPVRGDARLEIPIGHLDAPRTSFQAMRGKCQPPSARNSITILSGSACAIV